jgi:predicted nucleotidyltransferase
MMKQSIVNKLQDFFILQPIEKAWVFGSYSRGDETQESDIDILVRFDKSAQISLFQYISIMNALQNLLHKKVDMVEEGHLKAFAESSAEQDKILIYERKSER